MNEPRYMYAIWRGEIIRTRPMSEPVTEDTEIEVTRFIFRDPTPEDYATLPDLSLVTFDAPGMRNEWPGDYQI